MNDSSDLNAHPAPALSLLQRKAARLGRRGARWLAALPHLIAHLERDWSITVGAPLAGGSASFVARARTAEGRDAVLKLMLPEQGFAGQLRALERAEGRGYAELLAYDAEREALLLEALGPAMTDLELPPERMIALLCQTLTQAWQTPRPDDLTAALADEKAGRLARSVSQMWAQLGRPCSERVIAQAVRYAERRATAFDPQRCALAHGDPHPGNALQALAPRAGAESGFVFVDPDGLLVDPAYDLGVALRDWCPQLLAGDALPLARRYCALLSDLTGIEATAIWEWGFLERVSTGLYIMDIGAEALGRPFLETAEMLI